MQTDAAGILAIWNDRREDSDALYEHWYQTEHLAERVGLPGFVSGRRFEAIDASPRFFTYYETQSISVLRSEAYNDCVNAPSALTREIMDGRFLNMNRSLCQRSLSIGQMFGAVAVTARFESDPGDVEAQFGRDEGLSFDPNRHARIEVWRAAARDSAQTNAEQALRGMDARIKAGVLIELLRESAAMEQAKILKKNFPQAQIGVYRLLCSLTSP